MTSSINCSVYNRMDMTIINNAFKLSSNEQKNLAILILARHKLSFFIKQVKDDEFINTLYSWLEKNVMDYREIDLAFTAYFNAKEGTELKKELFKIIKPLQEMGVYLSDIAKVDTSLTNNKECQIELPKNIKVYVLSALSFWFSDLGKNTVYFNEIFNFKIQEELDKLNAEFQGFGFKNRESERKQLNLIFDYAQEVAETVSKATFKIIVPVIKGKRKSKK